MAKSVFTDEDDALLAELGVEVETKKVAARTPREERIIAGFEEIQRFVEQNDRLPSSTEGNDIFERIYATRLNQIRSQQECCDLLSEFDHQGLLDGDFQNEDVDSCELTDDELLEELGVSVGAESDITKLRHVKSQAEKQVAEEIANRTICEDFDTFKKLFDAVQQDLDTGDRKTLKFRKDAGFLKTDIKQGQFFILGGQTAYVAEVGEPIKAPNGEFDARLRVIYSNKTESDILLRSVVRAMYKDEASRLISEPNAGPLFSDLAEDEDLASGTIYVLRSKSTHPVITENRDVIHKIGVTGGKVEKRIANAKLDPTYLMADVEIVATYELYNINRTRLEKLLHRFFENAKLDIKINDRFGHPISPKEWFLVPLFIIDEVVEKIKDETLEQFRYDAESVSLVAFSG
ncbi:GIY-YIG nuclease family protein [Pelobacter seleniigenes]|uniref:GIY-YIG nuclease family protein n=1 Tax=Pelobacter seleniigenes TaxID=407188 RepID=UPI0004A6E93B|nr:GIY-YIG nuclease family protein [Pelobacter seleniigenes]